MSRISRKREKYDNGNELSGDNSNEGTAARTRPFTFEEIMLRRKNSKLRAEAKGVAGDPDKNLRKDNTKKVSNHSEPDGVYGDIANHASEDTVKRSSTKKQESTSLKEGHLLRGKGKESSDAETNVMEKLDKDMKNRDKGDKNEKRSRRRSRNEERSRDDFENESQKKHSGNSVRKDKYVDTDRRKSESENKRKQRTKDDEKSRFEIDGNAVKKHDSGKWYDLEPAGRKSRKNESSQSHYEEARPKRRKSRSHEKRDRDRRSISLSPRAHKRTSYQGREHGESSFHSFKDRKQYSDVDRNRTSSNGGYGNSHYPRRGGRGSRLGGYSPRKRRTEAAVKTPSPTIRSPERKSAGWDLPPTGTNVSSAGSMSNFQTSGQIVSSNVNELSAAVPAASNVAKPLSGASPNALSTSKNVSMDSIQLTQATRSMRRLDVENLPTSASDKSIMDCFNNFFLSSDAYHNQGTPACISCIINKEKGQALVEFLTPEDATTALSFDGRSFSGSILKVRRPDFLESATGVQEKPVAVLDAISDVIKDSPYKIFVGGISKVLSSDMVKEIASAFGPLRGYHFKINEDVDGACAFLEYVDKSITLNACAGLNGMKFGGQILTVVQATPDASIEDKTEEPPQYGVPEHAKALLSKPTKVLKLKHVLNQDELSTLSGPEVQEVLEDIRLECARYGTVKSVNIVRNGSGSSTAPGEVTNQADVRSSSQYPEDENNIKRTEATEEKIDPNSGENSRPEAPNGARESLVYGGDAENSRPSLDEHGEDNLNTDIPTSHLDTDTNPQGSPSQLDTTKDQSAQNDNNSTDYLLRSNSSIENSSMVEEELKPEEASAELQEVSIELNDTSRRNSDTNENCQSKQQVDVFEVGCVLVEYARTEASCAAAHCLHGRLYGDRVVVVGYVDRDLYISMFPK